MSDILNRKNKKISSSKVRLQNSEAEKDLMVKQLEKVVQEKKKMEQELM